VREKTEQINDLEDALGEVEEKYEKSEGIISTMEQRISQLSQQVSQAKKGQESISSAYDTLKTEKEDALAVTSALAKLLISLIHDEEDLFLLSSSATKTLVRSDGSRLLTAAQNQLLIDSVNAACSSADASATAKEALSVLGS
jgi:chromosome segregation ATPase